ncbi:aspartate 1-decarboxylase [Salinibacter ruber]|jgi:aspartate 1-decarboxylase|uniref:Aspartate 1-decarboxylase n=4 Tax=Salinibacter ruber TaxID=146919 RepID=PAND_SALRD|nr:aspartate 1-decarboxylase [Salinibacter ruber]Q2S2P5.1 RecName: Full=Aspartate 1-decarboxylase; AltName: Full=Aspartate alpha-decarboxylase; Contains: RecName: Full=Aspartate 1-decarboxylase beta chain; Contains: RecName: Full=Aspartate 1-decarboxylase alpha chain; Flags: Precursor [Salinibacter ruber DSM 13855]ABC46034.1 aspartate 1-decarboxylase [Salinibacter ruber DSM 13855]MBB4062222.1 aspartate 1-decarboxylase [Salinibacter ruber]MBB4068262.1 aspartate 1-decarboxylase [Salinibacter rube
MDLSMLRAKLHRLRVTEADLYYEGSITIDEELLDAAGLLPYEKVQVVNVNNGSRLETYTIPGEAGERTVCLNGPAARLAAPGDEVIVIAYAELTPSEAREHHPRVVHVDENNDVTKTRTLDVAKETDENLAPDGMEDVLIAEGPQS